jgi:hypothetical protein
MAPAGDRGRPTNSGEHSKQLFNQTGNMVGVKDETHYGESLMDALTSSLGAGEKPLSSDGDADGSRLITEKGQKRRPQIESDAEQIKSAVARLTSSSIDGLEGLASELQQLQEFLKCEVERVQAEIESALDGINIIIETIAPWKTMSVPIAAPTGARGFRAGPGANIEARQPHR